MLTLVPPQHDTIVIGNELSAKKLTRTVSMLYSTVGTAKHAHVRACRVGTLVYGHHIARLNQASGGAAVQSRRWLAISAAEQGNHVVTTGPKSTLRAFEHYT